MVGIHKRLQQIKGVSDDAVFGGVSVLAVGDLYQLVKHLYLALRVTLMPSYTVLVHCGSISSK